MFQRTSKFSIRNIQRRPRKLSRLIDRVKNKVALGAKLSSREATKAKALKLIDESVEVLF